MPKCNVIAKFSCKPEYLVAVREFLSKMAVEVLQEEGCELYELNEDVSGNLWFIETWTTRSLWMQHNDHANVQRILEFIDEKLAKPVEVSEMYPVK